MPRPRSVGRVGTRTQAAAGAVTRLIPATMATQHPDHVSTPFWKRNADPFISTQEEVEECYSNYHELRCQEYMWDWEGKYVDEAVVDKLFSTYYDFFRRVQIGRDVFLTFRLPNIWTEKGYRLARAYMGILTFENLSRDLGFSNPPVFEVILPMTDAAWKLLYLQETFAKVARFKQKTFGERQKGLTYLRVIPLIEGVSQLAGSRRILLDYIAGHTKLFGRPPEYLRPFVARSDPALNAGLVPATIAAKIALSEYHHVEQESGIPVFPIIGMGTPPFRGGLTPYTVDDFCREYAGVRTVTLQSAFRYDYPKNDVMEAVATLNRSLQRSEAVLYTQEEIRKGYRLIQGFSRFYRQSVERWAGMINELARAVPARRERLLHTGLFGYARGIRGKRLPRAIGFAAALYSIGIPPELIGTGRGLAEAREKGLLDTLFRFYRNLRTDLLRSGVFLNRENLAFLIKENSAWESVQQDVDWIEQILGIELGPQTTEQYHHRNLVSSAYLLGREGKDITPYIAEAARLRGGMG